MPTTIRLGDVMPDFTADTDKGEIRFHEWLGGGWAILFSHPADYTPVCTTELGRVQELHGEFEKRGCKVIALSIDTVKCHQTWIEDVKDYNKLGTFDYPIIADKSRDIATLYGMLDPEEKDSEGLPLTCRSLFVIGPDKRLKLQILYPASCGRNFEEVIRVLDSLQLTAYKKVATPADWRQGGQCMVLPSVSEEEAEKLFPEHKVVPVPSGEKYMRVTPQPTKCDWH